MVRLSSLKSQLRSAFDIAGTQGIVIGDAIPDGKFRRIYRIKLQQRGTTLSNVHIFKSMGATYGSATVGGTIDQFKFDVPNQIIDVDAVNDGLPLYGDINRATYDEIFVRTEVASVDVLIQYADEDQLEYRD